MNKRIILAFVLAISFFTLYSLFVMPYFAPQPAPPAPAPAVPAPEAAPAPAVAPVAAAPEQPQPQAAAPAAAPELQAAVPEKYRQDKVSPNDVTVSTDILTVTFTPRSGAVKSVVLNAFKNFDRSGPLVFMKDFYAGHYPLETTDVAGQDTSSLLFALESAPANNDPLAPRDISFATVLPSGLKVIKTYSLYPGKYGIRLQITVENLSAAPRSVSYGLTGPAGVPSEDMNRNDVVGLLATVPQAEGIQGKMEMQEVPAATLLQSLPAGTSVPPGRRANYAGAHNRYFAAVVRPEPTVPLSGTDIFAIPDSAEAVKLLGADKDPVKLAESLPAKDRTPLAQVFYTAGSRFTVGALELAAAGAPGAESTQSFLLYCGPKTKDALTGFDTPQAPTGLVALINYGWFEPLVKVILFLMSAFHVVTFNWGISIILLTLLVRLAMHPLTRKSQISMTKMQKLQPHIKKLQEKYKNDKQKLGSEQMKLMKEHGANPLGGCLPMLIQLPIFFALYRALMVSIDLRHASFYVIPGHWIKDLAQPDVLMTLPFTLPFLGSDLNVLPILMAVAMALQQLWAVKPATPEAAQQAKIMGIFMPIFMGVILYKFASGLNLYILTSTVSGIIEQWVIKRHLAAQDAASGQ